MFGKFEPTGEEIQAVYRRALAADDAFSAALAKQYGENRAGDARYFRDSLHNAETRAAKAAKLAADAELREFLNF